MSKPSRQGFTLIELLVVVGILIVLTGLTIALVNTTQNEDRIRAGAAQVQSFMEGARDRAIHSGKPRGVRFLASSDNPNPNTITVTSMLYVGSPEIYGKGQSANIIGRDYVDGLPTNWEVRPALDSELAMWKNFYDRKLIANGTLIQIEGQFYTIIRYRSGYIDRFYLTKKYQGNKFQGLKYGLHLSPTVLPNQEPRQLPRNVVIDLDNSIVPDAWNGTANFDVMFSPNGTVTGLAASAGIIHLYVADQADVDQVFDTDGDGIYDVRFTPGVDQIDPSSGANPPIQREGDERIVSLRTHTGAIGVHNVNPASDTMHPNDPFYYAAKGETAK